LPSPSIDPVWTRRLTPTEQANLAEEARATNGAGAAALAGMRFAVKDLIAVRGCVRGCGNPHWAARQQASTVSAVAVQRLLAAGARCLGTTWLDEFAFGLAGENAWGGTPPNPRAPGRIPGGSSSGSAAAVALGEADLALATDTAGSIRGPASWCGLWGLRPSHGAVSTAGVAALAPSLDTVGLFASSQEVLRQGMATLQEGATAGRSMAGQSPAAAASDAALETPPTVRAIGWIPELWDLADPAVTAPLQRQALELAEHLAHPLQPWPLAKLGIASPEALQRLLEVVQWAEIEQSLAQLPSDLPVGPSLERNRALVAGRDRSLLAAARIARQSLRERLQTLLGPGPSGGACLLLLPCTPTVAPPCGSLGIDRSTNSVIQRLLQLGALASLAGLPQLARPGSLDREHGLPVGLGVLTHAGGDRLLLELPAP
jgi:amidase